ncbi:PIR protein [Plasmodium vivax]|nr:PIR protein [Plasmodium vivax]
MERMFRGPNNYTSLYKQYTSRWCADSYHKYKEEIEKKINEFHPNGQRNFCQKCNSIRQHIFHRNDEFNYYCKNDPLHGKFIQEDRINDFITQCPELKQCRPHHANRFRKPVTSTRPTVGHCEKNGDCNRGAVPTKGVVGKAQTGPVIVSPGIREPEEKVSLGKDTSYGEGERTRLAKVVSKPREGTMHSRSSSMHVGASEPNVGHSSSTFELGQTKTQHLSPLPLSASSALSGGQSRYSAQNSYAGESGAFATSERKTLETKIVQDQLGNAQHIRDNPSYAQDVDGKIVHNPAQVDTDLASREAVNGHLTGTTFINGVSYGEGVPFNALHQEAIGSGDDLGGVPSSRSTCGKTADGINHCSEGQDNGIHIAANRAAGDDTQRTSLNVENIKDFVRQVMNLVTSQETQAIGKAGDSTFPHIGDAAQFPESFLQKLTELGVKLPEVLEHGQQVHLGTQGQLHMQSYSNQERFSRLTEFLGKVLQAKREGRYDDDLFSEVAQLMANHGNGENIANGETLSYDTGNDVGMLNEEDPMMVYKKYATMALAPTGVIMLMTLLTKFTPLGMFFTKKNRNKRNDMKEKIERLLLSESPVATEENNINFAYSPQYWET